MKVRTVIRYSRHENKEMVDHMAMVLLTGEQSEVVTHDLNIFFASQGLGYYAKVETRETIEW